MKIWYYFDIDQKLELINLLLEIADQNACSTVYSWIFADASFADILQRLLFMIKTIIRIKHFYMSIIGEIL